MFQAASPNIANGKICGDPSPLFGVVDFNKSCLEAQRKALTLSGRPVYYRRCSACRFLFTGVFDDWSPEIIAQTFAASRDSLSILDYGSGNGLLARLFEKNGMGLVSLTDLVHMAFRRLPAFASHLAGVRKG